MSKSCNFPNEIILDGYVLRQDKVCDGCTKYVGITLDPDYNKEDIEVIESRNSSYCFLQYDDRFSNYYLGCCEGGYFCNESDL